MVNDIIAVGGVMVGVLGSMVGLFPYLKKKGIDVDKAIGTVEKGLDTANIMMSVAEPLMPAPVVNVLELIKTWAKIAAGNAEQLSHAGTINKEEREQVAENVVLNVLQEAKVPVDTNKKALIDAAIKNTVNDLGHAPVSEAQIQAQLQQAQQQIAILQQEKAQLQQTINTIQSTAQTVQTVQNTQMVQAVQS